MELVLWFGSARLDRLVTGGSMAGVGGWTGGGADLVKAFKMNGELYRYEYKPHTGFPIAGRSKPLS
jgi:hypothetical protein